MVAEYKPIWLDVDDVKMWLRLQAQDTSDDDLLDRVAAMAEPYVERCRPEWFVQLDEFTRNYVPDPETYHGAVMYAAREYRRRNSPAGIETFGESTNFVSRWDPDIERALQTGSYARPIVS